MDDTETKHLDLLDFDGKLDYELETETVFAETLSLYRHMRKDLLCSLAETVVMEAKLRSKKYRNERYL